VNIINAFCEFLVGIFSEVEVFLMSFDLLVRLLNHLLVSQQPLLVLPDDVLRVALQELYL
jgi:hypothetical protein